MPKKRKVGSETFPIHEKDWLVLEAMLMDWGYDRGELLKKAKALIQIDESRRVKNFERPNAHSASPSFSWWL